MRKDAARRGATRHDIFAFFRWHDTTQHDTARREWKSSNYAGAKDNFSFFLLLLNLRLQPRLPWPTLALRASAAVPSRHRRVVSAIRIDLVPQISTACPTSTPPMGEVKCYIAVQRLFQCAPTVDPSISALSEARGTTAPPYSSLPAALRVQPRLPSHLLSARVPLDPVATVGRTARHVLALRHKPARHASRARSCVAALQCMSHYAPSFQLAPPFRSGPLFGLSVRGMGGTPLPPLEPHSHRSRAPPRVNEVCFAIEGLSIIGLRNPILILHLIRSINQFPDQSFQ